MLKFTKNLKKFSLGKFTLPAIFAACAGFGFAQTQPPAPLPTPPKKITVKTFPMPPKTPSARRVENEGAIPAEKSIAVDPKVSISMCVAEGNLKVNGWDRNEIRAMIVGGSEVGFKVRRKNAQNSLIQLFILGYDPAKNTEMGLDECLSGENIELDVPRGATVDVKGGEFDATIESVNKAIIKSDSGNIVLNEIAQGIDARTFEGDLRVQNSGGAITLSSTNGNIFAFNAEPVEVSDAFFAKTTSGSIKLQSVGHSQVVTQSISGILDYAGDLLNGGQYNFNTQNGSIVLTVPQTASSAVTARYGFGSFQSEIPMTNIIKDPANQGQKLTGIFGAGDASLNITTSSGAIRIKKTP